MAPYDSPAYTQPPSSEQQRPSSKHAGAVIGGVVGALVVVLLLLFLAFRFLRRRTVNQEQEKSSRKSTRPFLRQLHIHQKTFCGVSRVPPINSPEFIDYRDLGAVGYPAICQVYDGQANHSHLITSMPKSPGPGRWPSHRSLLEARDRTSPVPPSGQTRNAQNENKHPGRHPPPVSQPQLNLPLSKHTSSASMPFSPTSESPITTTTLATPGLTSAVDDDIASSQDRPEFQYSASGDWNRDSDVSPPPALARINTLAISRLLKSRARKAPTRSDTQASKIERAGSILSTDGSSEEPSSTSGDRGQSFRATLGGTSESPATVIPSDFPPAVGRRRQLLPTKRSTFHVQLSTRCLFTKWLNMCLATLGASPPCLLTTDFPFMLPLIRLCSPSTTVWMKSGVPCLKIRSCALWYVFIAILSFQ
jgi:hypothetical protein